MPEVYRRDSSCLWGPFLHANDGVNIDVLKLKEAVITHICTTTSKSLINVLVRNSNFMVNFTVKLLRRRSQESREGTFEEASLMFSRAIKVMSYEVTLTKR